MQMSRVFLLWWKTAACSRNLPEYATLLHLHVRPPPVRNPFRRSRQVGRGGLLRASQRSLATLCTGHTLWTFGG